MSKRHYWSNNCYPSKAPEYIHHFFFYVAQSSVFCVVFYGLLFFLFNFIWPFYYLSFDLRIPITLLVSSIFSCQCGRLQRNNFPNYPLSPRFQWQYLIQNRFPQFINAHYRCNLALNNNQPMKTVIFWEFNKLQI